MRTISFFFNFKPLSVNAAYKTTRKGLRVKSDAYKEYQQKVLRKIDGVELSEFSRHFDEKKHALKMNLIVYLPDFYTSKGAISKTALDLMNAEKILIDIIFKNSGLPDSHITEAFLSKNKGERNCFFLNLEIINK